MSASTGVAAAHVCKHPNSNRPCLKNFVKHEFFRGGKLLTLLAATRAVTGTLYVFVFMCSSSDSSPAAFSGVSHLSIASIYKERRHLSRFHYPMHDRVTVHTSPFSPLNFLPLFNQSFHSFPLAALHFFAALSISILPSCILVCACVSLCNCMSLCLGQL